MKQLYFLIVLLIGLVPIGQAQNSVEVDVNAAWIGFMNVFETPANGGGYVFGSGWGVPDLKSTIDPGAGTVTLQPNFNTYADNPTDPFWVDQTTGEGNKSMESNTFIEDNSLVGSELTFSGNVASNTLDANYTAIAFIKVFNADFSVLKIETTPLVSGADFTVNYTDVEGTDAVVQYGFQVVGINANPVDEATLGSVVVTAPAPDQTTVNFDSNAAWIGYMNVFETPANGGGFVFGSGWGVPDLKTVVDTSVENVVLQPNFNVWGDGTDPFWVDQTTGEGNKTMEANTYVEDNSLVGDEVTFTGPVADLSIDPGYTALAFIKVFNADFSILKIETVPLVSGETFEVTYTDVEGTDAVVQYGFQIIGINANPANEEALGSVVVGNPIPGEISIAFDANAAWLGFMNVFETPSNGGGYVFGSGWEVADLQTIVDPAAGNVILQPNFNVWGDGTDPFWVDQSTGLGNKTMEANTFVEDNALIGNELTFTGAVPTFTLDPGYTAQAFIKVFNADFSILKIETVPLVEDQTFSVSYTNVEAEDAVVQYGFQVIGLNANPIDETALGSVVIGNPVIPGNDNCLNAVTINCGETVSGTTMDATDDTGNAPDCETTVSAPGVWYVFEDTTGFPTNITMSTCDQADYDTKIHVYTGGCDDTFTCVASNDDGAGCGGFTSELSFESNGSTTYYILINGFNGAEGNFDLTVSCDILPPPNDLIVNATDLSNEDFPFTDPNVPMMAATLEGGNPTDCNIDGANGVWYKGTIPQNGNVTATVVNPSGANAVTFYEAPNLNASEADLVLVDWFENQCVAGTSASIPVVAGNSYYVFVLNSGGPTDILLEFTPTLSTNDNTIEGFAFYPNPTTGVVQLRAMNTIENVEVYNLLGQRVLIEGIASNASEINIAKLNAGTYLMKVSVNGQIGTYRILKQ